MNENEAVTSEIRDYLELIRSTIERMSSTSSIIKGFAATVITGIAALSMTEISKWILLLSFTPILSFGALDVYYLKLERKYRYLYNQVRTSKRPCDFSMEIKFRDKAERRLANASIAQCLQSPSIWLFYAPVIMLAFLICYFKFSCIV